MKTCTRCGETKPIDDYWNQRARPDGKAPWCKACQAAWKAEYRQKNREAELAKDRERSRRWRARNDKSEQTRRLLYGMSPGQYDQMLADQGGVCAICGKAPTGTGSRSKLRVDHCHTSGRVRGLLCNSCNLAVGNFRDDPEIMRKAIEYLT